MKHKFVTLLAALLSLSIQVRAQPSQGATPSNPYSKDAISAAVEAQLSKNNTLKGQDLYQRVSKEMFLSYVTGVDDVGTMTGDSVRRYCRPQGATNGQMGDVVMKYLTLYPETRHLGAAYLVRQALHEAWPCLQPVPEEKKPLPRPTPNM